MILRVTAPYFCAGALWRKDRLQWVCYHTAPILKWMKGLSPLEVKLYLDRREWQYEWIQETDNGT